MMDAYTIRKVLPRLLVAVIFINLSWPILQYLVELTNIVGVDIRSIIYTPFNSIGKGGVVTISGGATTVGALVGGSAFALGLIGVGGLVTMAFLAVAVGFIVLLLRQVIIMMLIVSAPLAIACYVLPATEKFWRIWRDTLITMLIMFPIISAFIAMGRVGAVVMYNASMYSMPAFTAVGQMFGLPTHTATLQSLPPLVKQLGAATLWFLSLPLAVILGFKASGRASAALHGIINGNLKSGLGGGKKGGKQGKQGGFADRLKRRFKQGEFHAPPLINRIPGAELSARAFGRVTSGVALGVRGRFGLPTSRGREAYSQSQVAAAMKLTETEAWRANKEKDDFLRAGTYASAGEAMTGLQAHFENQGLTAAASRVRARQAVAGVQASGLNFGQPLQIASAKGMYDTKTAYGDVLDQAVVANRAARGAKVSRDDILGYGNAVSHAPRADNAPGFGAITNLGDDIARGVVNPDRAANTAATQERLALLTVQGWRNSGSPGTIAGAGKEVAAANLASAVETLSVARLAGRLNDNQWDEVVASGLELQAANAQSGGGQVSRLLHDGTATQIGIRASLAGAATDDDRARVIAAGLVRRFEWPPAVPGGPGL